MERGRRADGGREPRWRLEDLGWPIPDDRHAISVCLPTWESVVRYEEGDPEVRGMLRSGYPRFLVPQDVEALHRMIDPSGMAVVFASVAAARRAAAHARAAGGAAEAMEIQRLGVVRAGDPAGLEAVRIYRRSFGEGISSRAAGAVLGGRNWYGVDGEAARTAIRQELARWHGVADSSVFLFGSGMAAVAAIHRSLRALAPDRGTVQVDFPYVDVGRIQKLDGATMRMLRGDAALAGGLEHAVADGFSAGVLCEIPANPLLDCVDITGLAGLAERLGVPVVADDTVASVANVALLPWVDAVTTSLSKWFNGRCNLLAGSVVVRPGGRWESQLTQAMAAASAEAPLGDADAHELARNQTGFAGRVRVAGETAGRLARYLERHPAVARVWYPRDGGMDKILRSGGNRGGLLSLQLAGGEAAAARFYDALPFDKGPSLGAEFALVCPYTLLAHYGELGHAAGWGVPKDLIRFSAGIEDSEAVLMAIDDVINSIP